MLRIDYPGFSGEETLQPIEWDEFFEQFEANNLAFLYQGGKGNKSRFSKLVSRESAGRGGRGGGGGKGRSRSSKGHGRSAR